jgi:hypothetical protein
MRHAFSLVALEALAVPVEAGGGIQEIVQLTAPDVVAGDSFGWAVAISGDTVAVGSPGHEPEGAVYVFERDLGGPDAWGLAEKLLPPPPWTFGDWFGWAVALEDDTLAVGMPYYDLGGAVFVYERGPSGFALATTGLGGDQWALGWSLDLEGDTLVAGAPSSCSPYWGPCEVERAIVYGRDVGGAGAWGVLQGLLSPTGGCDGFGGDVDLDRDTLVVGAPVDDYYCPASNPGSAHLYSRPSPGATFSWQVALPPSQLNELPAVFGKAVALDGLRAASKGIDREPPSSWPPWEGPYWAVVEIWEGASAAGPWQPVDAIYGPIEGQMASFGDSLLLRGDLLLVGHPWRRHNSNSPPGRVWLYRRSPQGKWLFQGWTKPQAAQRDDWFGQSMDSSESLLVVGAPAFYADILGAAYVFLIEPPAESPAIAPATGW